MRKKLVYVLVTVTITAGMLAGCGSSGSGSSEKGSTGSDSTAANAADSGSEKQSITFMIPDWGVPTDEMLDEFTNETGIEVVISEVSWDDIRDKVTIAASGGEAAADVVEVDWSWVGEFYDADWLEPLEVSDADKSDIPTLSTFTVDGKVLAMPYANDYRLSYYNTAQYEKAGLKEPSTWDEVYNNAKTLKEKGVTDYPFTIPLNAEESSTTSLIMLAYAMNGVVFNDDGTLNKDSVLAALKYEEQMLKDDLIDPADKSSSGMDAYRKILSGEASFMTGPTSFVARSVNTEESKVIGDIMPILVPGSDGKAKQTMALPEAIGVTKFSKNKEAAKKFVEWYTSADMQKKLQASNSAIPTRNSVLESLINDGTIKNAGAMLEEAKLIATPFPKGVPSYYSEMSNAMFNAVNKMALGEYTAEEAFDNMNEAVTKLTNK